ncbi:MAG: DUF1376 domain-containing protein [Alphaproteobacteria bacterium]|nr:DUF1376 domain-containing protein [Alphaproteobacteria bacterium]
MHSYQYHIGDMRSGTIHFTRLMRWLYRDMMDAYYDSELPLPLEVDEICHMIGAIDQDGEVIDKDRQAVMRVLKAKFTQEVDGYHHHRIDAALTAYREAGRDQDERRENERLRQQLYRQRRSAIFTQLREEFDVIPKYDTPMSELQNILDECVNIAQNKDKQDSHTSVTRDKQERTEPETAITSNRKPVTVNQEPEEQSANKAGRGCRLPENWHPGEEGTAFCKANRPDLRPSEVARKFYDYWRAVPGAKGRKLDWMATWRNFVMNERTPVAASLQNNTKFDLSGVDRSLDQRRMDESMKKHGITEIPDGEINF